MITDAQIRADGMYHFGMRFYDPSLRRWNQQDPTTQPATCAKPTATFTPVTIRLTTSTRPASIPSGKAWLMLVA